MNTQKLRNTQDILNAIDATVGNMKINRLQVLIELVLAGGELPMSDLINRLGLARAHASKVVASWTKLTHTKQPGPGYVENAPDPMNLNTRIVKLTPAGRKYIEQIAGE